MTENIDPALLSAVESLKEAHEADQNITFTWDEMGVALAAIEKLRQVQAAGK